MGVKTSGGGHKMLETQSTPLHGGLVDLRGLILTSMPQGTVPIPQCQVLLVAGTSQVAALEWEVERYVK